MGVLFTKQQLDVRGAIPSQIEIFSGFCAGSAGMRANYGTYSSLGNFFFLPCFFLKYLIYKAIFFYS
jgi:hypothetical protein